MDGLFIHVANNTRTEKPLVIYQLYDADKSKMAVHTRLFVNVEANAEFKIIEKTNSIGKHSIFHTFNEDIMVGENANFNYCKIQNDPGQIMQVSNTTIHQQKSSRVDTYTFTMNGQLAIYY